MSDFPRYAYESGPRLKIAVVGCGSHAYRSLFPSFDYLAVDLIATCDKDLERARTYARRFGATAACASLAEVIDRGDVEAVVLAAGPRQHPDLACEALSAGLHVWMEKPPALDVAGVDRMRAARDASGRYAAVGFKKVFMPALRRLKAFLDGGEFGPVRTIQGRFPLDIPPDGPAILAEGRLTNWLNNGVHPLSALLHLGGRPEAVTAHRAAAGGGFLLMEFPGGALGCLHLAEGQSMSGPMERYEVVCERGHLALDNNVHLSVHRPGYPFDYGRGWDFAAGGAEVAALVYAPQHTLSTLENKAVFLQGFVPELAHFVSACLSGAPPTLGTLEFARAVMESYEAGLLSQGSRVRLDDDLLALRSEAL